MSKIEMFQITLKLNSKLDNMEEEGKKTTDQNIIGAWNIREEYMVKK